MRARSQGLPVLRSRAPPGKKTKFPRHPPQAAALGYEREHMRMGAQHTTVAPADIAVCARRRCVAFSVPCLS